jgi:methyltransferase (TIGR00027 family)
MKPTQSSWTSIYTTAKRAIESEKPAGQRICYDPLARKFIGPVLYSIFKIYFAFPYRQTPTTQKYILYRSRFFDDYLGKCLSSGVNQLVILGAGLDSRAYRGEMLKREVKTFEVDHPATQAQKIQMVRRTFGRIPAHVVYVPMDFMKDTLDTLPVNDYNPSIKTVFLCEGVTYYLNAESVGAILTWIGSHAAVNSSVLLDYKAAPPMQRKQPHRKRISAIIAEFAGEKRSYGMDKNQMEVLLKQSGLSQIEDVNGEQLARLYQTNPDRGRRFSRKYSIVSAVVGKDPKKKAIEAIKKKKPGG